MADAPVTTITESTQGLNQFALIYAQHVRPPPAAHIRPLAPGERQQLTIMVGARGVDTHATAADVMQQEGAVGVFAANLQSHHPNYTAEMSLLPEGAAAQKAFQQINHDVLGWLLQATRDGLALGAHVVIEPSSILKPEQLAGLIAANQRGNRVTLGVVVPDQPEWGLRQMEQYAIQAASVAASSGAMVRDSEPGQVRAMADFTSPSWVHREYGQEGPQSLITTIKAAAAAGADVSLLDHRGRPLFNLDANDSRISSDLFLNDLLRAMHERGSTLGDLQALAEREELLQSSLARPWAKELPSGFLADVQDFQPETNLAGMAQGQYASLQRQFVEEISLETTRGQPGPPVAPMVVFVDGSSPVDSTPAFQQAIKDLSGTRPVTTIDAVAMANSLLQRDQPGTSWHSTLERHQCNLLAQDVAMNALAEAVLQGKSVVVHSPLSPDLYLNRTVTSLGFQGVPSQSVQLRMVVPTRDQALLGAYAAYPGAVASVESSRYGQPPIPEVSVEGDLHGMQKIVALAVEGTGGKAIGSIVFADCAGETIYDSRRDVALSKDPTLRQDANHFTLQLATVSARQSSPREVAELYLGWFGSDSKVDGPPSVSRLYNVSNTSGGESAEARFAEALQSNASAHALAVTRQLNKTPAARMWLAHLDGNATRAAEWSLSVVTTRMTGLNLLRGADDLGEGADTSVPKGAETLEGPEKGDGERIEANQIELLAVDLSRLRGRVVAATPYHLGVQTGGNNGLVVAIADLLKYRHKIGEGSFRVPSIGEHLTSPRLREAAVEIGKERGGSRGSEGPKL